MSLQTEIISQLEATAAKVEAEHGPEACHYFKQATFAFSASAVVASHMEAGGARALTSLLGLALETKAFSREVKEELQTLAMATVRTGHDTCGQELRGGAV